MLRWLDRRSLLPALAYAVLGGAMVFVFDHIVAAAAPTDTTVGARVLVYALLVSTGVLIGALAMRRRPSSPVADGSAPINEGQTPWEARQRYRGVFDNHHAVMLLIDPDSGRIVEANAAASEFYGWSVAELCLMNIKQLNTLSATEVDAHLQMAKRNERNAFSFSHRLADGSTRQVDVYSGTIGAGDHALLLSIIHDQAALHAAERAVVESEERLRLALDVGRQGIWDFDVTTGEVLVSPEYARMLGYDPAEFRETLDAWRDRIHLDDRERTLKLLTEHLEGRQPEYRAEFRLRTKSGAWKWIQSVGRVTSWDAQRKPVRMNGMHTDVTPLKEAEARVARYTKRAQGLLDLPRVAEMMTEREFMQHGQELIEELTGSTIAFTHLVHEDEDAIELVTWSRRTLREYCTAVYDSHYPISQAGIWADAFRMRRAVVFNDYAGYAGKRGLPEGHARLDRLISCPVIDGGKVRMLTGVGNRETEYSETDVETVQVLSDEIWRIVKRRRDESSLRSREERYRRLFDANPQPMWVYDPDSLRFLAVNNSATVRYGYSRDEFLAMTIADLVPPEDLAIVNTSLTAALGRRLSTARVWRHRNKYGTLLDVDVSTHEVDFEGRRAIMVLALDVTEQRRAEAAIAESEERLRLTTAMAGIAVWEFDYGTGQVSRSALYDQLYGLPWQGAGASAVFNRRIHPEDLPRYKAAFEQAAAVGAGDRFTLSYRVVWSDLSVHWLECAAQVTLRDAMGYGLRARGVLMEITPRKNEEIAAEVHREELERLCEALEQRLGECKESAKVTSARE